MKNAIWFTNDLRLADNKTVNNAFSNYEETVAVFLKEKNLSTHQTLFLNESLNDLAAQLKACNIPLYLFDKDDNKNIANFFTVNNIGSISTSQAFNSRKKTWHSEMQQLLPRVEFNFFNSETLVDLDLHQLSPQNINDNFTAFRKKIEANWIINPLTESAERRSPKVSIKSEFDIFKWHEPSTSRDSQFIGGRTEGLKRINHYLFETQKILDYKETRNGMIEFDDSSKFSPWLAWGCVSAKEIYWEIKKFESIVKNNESTYWMIFELLWRDYFKFLADKYNEKLFSSFGLQNRSNTNLPDTKLSQNNTQKAFESWKFGKTPDPFINANMIELYQTGWMSNRGRQNVANYLVKTLNVDWVLGAEWFAKNLIDYDCENNWGNWLYQSGFGTDPRNRVFNPRLQAQMYDPTQAYVNKWLSQEMPDHEN